MAAQPAKKLQAKIDELRHPHRLCDACRPNARRVLHNLVPREDSERRSEEHTSELQSLMRSSYAVLCLKKKTTDTTPTENSSHQINNRSNSRYVISVHAHE